jgi:uncharacterized protein (TIGR02246 family)
MRNLLITTAAVLAATTGLALANPKNSADEDAIRALPKRIESGWSQGSGRMIGDVYATDGKLVAGDGTVTVGREQISAYHDQLFANYLKGTKLLVEVTDVRFLTPDIALMHTAGGILWPGEQQLKPGNDGIQSFVTVRQDGAWRVLLFQNTRVQPKR